MKGKKILDIGTANGRAVDYFISKGFEAIGIDNVDAFLEIAKKRVPGAKFFNMDMRKLEFPDNEFDGIWASASFLHIPKSEGKKTLEEFRRVLRPEGILYLSVIEGNEELFFEDPKYPKDTPRFFARYENDELKELIEKAGFEIIDIEYSPKVNYNRVNFITVFGRKC